MEFESPRFTRDELLHAILNDPDTGTRKLGPGSPPESVKLLQQALWDLSWVAATSPGTLHQDFVIGIYGPKTQAAVIGYKTNYGIHFPPDAPTGFVDEYAGPRTFRRLDRHCVMLDRATAALFTKLTELQTGGVPLNLVQNPDPQAPHTIPVRGTPGAAWECLFYDDTSAHLYTRAETGTFMVTGVIDQYYRNAAGGPGGWLGFPITDEYISADGNPTVEFEGGTLTHDLQEDIVFVLENGVAVEFGDQLSRF